MGVGRGGLRATLCGSDDASTELSMCRRNGADRAKRGNDNGGNATRRLMRTATTGGKKERVATAET